MIAYHGKPELKAAMLAEMAWHREQDKIVQGTYGEGSNGDWRGCSIGCAVHSLMRLTGEKLDTSSHRTLEEKLGIPEALWHINDAIFENLPIEQAREWPGVFLGAVQVGANLSMVAPQFQRWLLVDPTDGVRFTDSAKQAAKLLEFLMMAKA